MGSHGNVIPQAREEKVQLGVRLIIRDTVPSLLDMFRRELGSMG